MGLPRYKIFLYLWKVPYCTFWIHSLLQTANFFKNQYFVVQFHKYKLFYTSASSYALQYWWVFQ